MKFLIILFISMYSSIIDEKLLKKFFKHKSIEELVREKICSKKEISNSNNGELYECLI